MASYSDVGEIVDLISNGAEEHIGLVAKQPGSTDSFAVAPGSYHAGKQYPNYQHPSFRLLPGLYDVDVVLTGRGGREGRVRLEVEVPAEAGDLVGRLR